MKLTDTQLVLLSAASQREGGLIDSAVTGHTSAKVVGKLLGDELIEEVAAQGGLPVWRRDQNSEPRALRITERGLEVIGAQPDGGSVEVTQTNQKSTAEWSVCHSRPRLLENGRE